MTKWINYHHLFYFKTIAEEGSVSKAAEKLRLGQPTLSAQLKQFEDTIGVKLFDRQHKKLILTEQGQVALDYAKNIFKMGSEMFEVLHDRIVPQKISLQIGALDSVAKQIVVQLAKHAYKTADCLITLVEGKSDELIRELVAHRVDILVTNFLPSGVDAKGLSYRLVSKNNVGLYGAPAFRNLRKNFPQSISGQPLILPTYDSKLRFDLDHWAKSQEITLNTVAEGQDIAVKKLMAVDGLGIIPAANYSVNRQVLMGELIEIGQLRGVHEELYLVSASRKLENPIASKIMKSFHI
ncbi:MAG: LysR family transcriptional regulator [Proteobacteria bacterium]|nr:LysR family transcriptional regulator [Pseudomonadota bacterium]